MENHLTIILSEKILHFSAGEIYLVQSKIDLNEKDLFSCDTAFYLNYPFDQAEKIVPFFESLGVKEQEKIIKSIQETYGYKIRVDDVLGKLIVVLFFNIEFYDFLIVGLVGLGENSINALIEIGGRLILNNKRKTIVFTTTSPELSEAICVSILSGRDWQENNGQ